MKNGDLYRLLVTPADGIVVLLIYKHTSDIALFR